MARSARSIGSIPDAASESEDIKEKQFNYVSQFDAQITAMVEEESGKASRNGGIKTEPAWTLKLKVVWFTSITAVFVALLAVNIGMATGLIFWASNQTQTFSVPINMEQLISQEIKKNKDGEQCKSPTSNGPTRFPALQVVLTESGSKPATPNVVNGWVCTASWTCNSQSNSIDYYDATTLFMVKNAGVYQVISHLSFKSNGEKTNFTHQIEKKIVQRDNLKVMKDEVLLEETLQIDCSGMGSGSVCHTSMLMGVVQLAKNDNLMVKTNLNASLIRDKTSSYFALYMLHEDNI